MPCDGKQERTKRDPSLFHDDDGRKYWLNMVWDHRPDRHPFPGITLRQGHRNPMVPIQ